MKKYLVIIMIILSLFLISSVTAQENNTDASITFPEEVPIKYHNPEYVNVYMSYFDWDERDHRTFHVNFNLTEKSVIKTPSNNTHIGDKLNPNLTVFLVNRTLDGNATILIEGNSNATGLIYLSFLKDPLNFTDGRITYTIHNLEKKGSYKFDLYYEGNGIFNNCTYKELYITIPSFSTTVIPKKDNITMYYKDGTRFSATLYDDIQRPMVGKLVYVFVNGVRYDKYTNNNGSFSLGLNLNAGQYTIEVVYEGIWGIVSGNRSFFNLTILPTLIDKNLVKFYKNNTQYKITVLDRQGKIVVNGTVLFNINGVLYNKTTDSQGIAKLNINLAPGNYIITTTNNDSYKVSNNITVLPTIESGDLVKVFRNGSQFSVKLLNKDGTPLANEKLTMNVHGVIYKRTTNSQGLATLNINLAPGNYIITTENLKDGCMVSNNIQVKSYLYTFDMVKYYKNASRYCVKLVDENYNPVSGEVVEIEINGVKYTKTTNKDGIASLGINLLPGQYQAYAKCLNRDVSSITNIQVIPTLYIYNENSAALNEKYNDYAVILLDGSGNPLANETVVYEVKNTRVDVKTNSEGIAKFPASKLSQYVSSPHPLPVPKIDVKVSYDNQFVSSSIYFVHGFEGFY